MSLTDREKILIKIAIASTLEVLKKVNDDAANQMRSYAARNADRPDKAGYYDTHRQFEELGYALEQEIEMRTCYDEDLWLASS